MTRITVTYHHLGEPMFVPVYAVPFATQEQAVLRQVFSNLTSSSPSQYSRCELYANGAPVFPLLAQAAPDLLLPFQAGDVLSVLCADETSVRWVFVFSS